MRVPLFPTPYEGELFYSIIARFQSWLSYTAGQTRIELDTYRLALTLPGHLTRLCSRLPHGTIIDSNYFIDNHSILQIFYPFVDQSRITKIENAMRTGSNALVNILVARERKSISDFLRFCPDCIEQDKNIHGEAFWHTIHQLRGVWYCHRHQTQLINSSINVVHRTVRRIEALSNNTGQAQEQLPKVHNIQPLHDVVENYAWLLRNRVKYLSRDVINSNYRILLKRAGLMTGYGYLDTKKCYLRLTETFPDYYLKECEVVNPGIWFYSTIYPSKAISHPLRHIILLVALGITIEQFITGEFGQPVIGYTQEQSKQVTDERFEKRRIKLRKIFKWLIAIFPDAAKEQLRKVSGKQYCWLRKHDSEWFKNNMPMSRLVLRSQGWQDPERWNKKDLLMSEAVREAASKLRSAEKPVWISMESLKRETGLSILNERDEMKKYPLTRQALLEVRESCDSYRLRKVNYILSNIPPDVKVTKTKLLRRSGINSANVPPILQEGIKRMLGLREQEIAACLERQFSERG